MILASVNFDIGVVIAIVIPAISGLAWLIHLESRVKILERVYGSIDTKLDKIDGKMDDLPCHSYNICKMDNNK